METKIGITTENRATVVMILCRLLADEYVLSVKTRNAHWNVEGNDFYNKHLFFEQQYARLDEIVDSVAERIRTLGHYAPGTLKSFLDLTHLSETKSHENSSIGFINELLSDHESITIYLRENIDRPASELKDYGSSDFLTSLLETHEKMAWMLRAHVK
ncbi:DNA starvation/stationary phase protection protein [Flavobacterium album]|uniref:DNA starvation/stationary phase protection protein n=1 Tax=Flavobacterium album TaxID=2175091 RepID=A0A2S1QZD8_9FLAO|nr:DNA starvation/stationary phase protection protein [Flavobacterium album]AWH85669.1 DNA starvation/stationary phase protection protein [Flavobacterium album]